MRKILLICSIFFLGNLFINAQSYAVSGAGNTAVDGCYTFNGNTNPMGNDVYEHSGGVYFMHLRSGAFWLINTNTSNLSSGEYRNTTTSATPPSTGWTAMISPGPAPTVATGCGLPDEANIQVNSDTICESASTLLYVASSLSLGTDWYWYTDSCGGAFIGTGDSIIIAPSTTTNYYCRAEDGASFQGICDTITINVLPAPMPMIMGSNCLGAGSTILSIDTIPGATYAWGTPPAIDTWTDVGGYDVAPGSIDGFDMAFNQSTNDLYVAFEDESISPNKLSVMKYDGTSWAFVGSQGFSSSDAYEFAMTINPSTGHPAVALRDGAAVLGAYEFDGTNWVPLPTVASSGGKPKIAFNPSTNEPYVAYQQNTGNIVIKRYDGANWQIVGAAIVPTGGGVQVIFKDLGFNPSTNEPYVTYIHNEGVFSGITKKFDGSNWVVVGTPGFNGSWMGDTQIAFHPSTNEPYICYTDGSQGGYVSVARYDGTDWATVGNTGFGVANSYYLSLEFNNVTNEPYVTFQTSGAGPSALKYDGVSWEYVGFPNFAPGNTIYPKLAFNSISTEPYVGFQDIQNGDGLTVMKFIEAVETADSIVVSSPGTYAMTITYPNGCLVSSSDTINVIAGFPTISTINPVNCSSYTSPSGNYTWTTSNTYLDTITNVGGCDSIVTINLTVNNPTTGTDVQATCGAYTWIDGNTYTSSNNTAMDTLVNAAGCDSLVTLDLTILIGSAGTDIQTACDSYSWIDGNIYTSNNNTATHTLTNAAGCDSIVTLDLTILIGSAGTDIQTACDSYTWMDGNTYTASNTSATYTLTNAIGCDSVVTLNLTINNTNAGTDTQSACDSYTWIDGNTYTASNNVAMHTLTNFAGCDSVVTLDLTINTIDVTITNTTPVLTSNATGATYQWLDCNNAHAIIPGETGVSYTATANGDYAVEITLGSCTDTSACENVNTISIIENDFGDELVVFPNPTDGNFSIDLGSVYESVEISISDVNGKLIRSESFGQEHVFNMSINEPNGIYLITIITGDKRADIRLIKN